MQNKSASARCACSRCCGEVARLMDICMSALWFAAGTYPLGSHGAPPPGKRLCGSATFSLSSELCTDSGAGALVTRD
eukprot:6487230-Amphidinium_carterae.1